ncbi:Pilus assembly protein, PilP [Desulfuromusa kysingii]|uniref:Pilus assembly protein, PilP n=1 Tax=Desulfuromusa kysingii TaxID=37625 RepID=A0A1H4CYS9_9BACT|nr:pilus assembly protein PilP [Desulfuromusa kysingii]SEA65242.1 Pilus assembly protein, PilP [Desulfuromusa kysingii]
MRTTFLKSIPLLSVFLLFCWCSIPAVAQENPAQAEMAKISELSATSAQESQFTYSPKGRRDPFKPLIQEKQKIAGKVSTRPEKIKGPLEKYELSQYRLIAMMVVSGTPRAMVKAPDGKSYTVKVGEYIGMNDGIVKNIETKNIDIDENGMRIEKSPDRIVVEEVSVDSDTGKETREHRYIVM